MFENVKTVEELESELGRIKACCREIVPYIDVYLNTLRLDDHHRNAAGYSRMMEIVEAKIQDMAR